MKINHAERVKRAGVELDNCSGGEFYDALLGKAAGAKEAAGLFSKCVERLQAHGLNEGDISSILVELGDAMQRNGFNAGFDAGFAEGALLARFGGQAS